MNPKTVITKINQLVKQFGSHKAVANELQISLSYVYLLQKGTKKASPALLKLINLTIQNEPPTQTFLNERSVMI